MKKAFITTLGCKVNQFESASFKTGFEKQGLIITDNINEADIIVINTCAVTRKASAQSRQEIRKAARRNQQAAIVVTGCQAQLAADELRRIPDIAPERLRIFGNAQKEMLVPRVLEDANLTGDIITKDLRNLTRIGRLEVKQFGNRTRAYLRVQDGCNNFCSYCIVPLTRGQSRSLPEEEVINQARLYAAAGHKEIVVTGIHVGQYGRDLGQENGITALMTALCCSAPDVRYRLSSIEPLEISKKLLTLMSELSNFMPHLHIPLQSGDNEILNRMNRRYTREQFLSVIENCRAHLPDAAIGIDVLVGFPGESRKQFNNTKNLLEQVDCTYLHVFPYSKRPGTKAAAFKSQVTKQEKSRRVEELRKLGEKKKSIFYKRQTGTHRKALIEGERDREGNLKGFTDNYIPIRLTGSDNLKKNIVNVRLGAVTKDFITADLVSDL